VFKVAGPGRGKKGEKPGSKKEPGFSDPPTLADIGIDKKESSDAQALAKRVSDHWTDQPRLL
jgi:hypothetical protein